MKPISLFLALLILAACESSKSSRLIYSTSSDKALFEFRKGWVQIMDEGRYSAAEDSYRMAVEHDPHFLIGKSVLARLTLDLNERLAFEKELYAKRKEVKGDERLLLDVYYALVRYTNLRDQNSALTKEALDHALLVAEKNLRQIVHKYPEEVYLKAEYIEILNSLYGPTRALDSLHSITTNYQKENPFLLGVSASMYADLKEFDIAIQKSNQLKTILNDSTIPKSYAVLAAVNFKMGNLQIARINVNRAFALDSRNLDASRLKTKIDTAFKAQNKANSDDIK